MFAIKYMVSAVAFSTKLVTAAIDWDYELNGADWKHINAGCGGKN